MNTVKLIECICSVETPSLWFLRPVYSVMKTAKAETRCSKLRQERYCVCYREYVVQHWLWKLCAALYNSCFSLEGNSHDESSSNVHYILIGSLNFAICSAFPTAASCYFLQMVTWSVCATQTHILLLIYTYSSRLNLARKSPTNLMNSEVDGQ
jgi:hypothetical protein